MKVGRGWKGGGRHAMPHIDWSAIIAPSPAPSTQVTLHVAWNRIFQRLSLSLALALDIA